MYKKIFSRGKINGCVIKNKVILSPMDDALGQASGELTPRAIEYYANKAKNGCGLVHVGYISVTGPELGGVAITGQPHLRTLDDSHAMNVLADRVHEYGGKLFCQLMHPGRKTSAKYNEGHMPVSSTALPSQMVGKTDACHELTKEEIKQIVQDFARGAELAYKASADGVEIHCAHFYLLNQFMSPVRNERTDEYGGSLENRCRIVVEIIQEIRKRVPKSFPITARIHILEDEGYEDDLTIDDMIEMCKYLEAKGIDAFDFSIGTIDRTGTPEMKAGWRNEYYKRVKKEINVPIYGPNEVKTPDEAEQFLEEGVYDFISMGRQLTADPEWCVKAKEGRQEDIRPCISCNFCLQRVTADESQIRCVVNPLLGREIDNLAPLAKGEGLVVVIGAGPAGLQASITLSERGFKVLLIEAGPELGGALNLANKAPGKFRIDNLIRYYIHQVEKDKNIEVRLNSEITVDKLDEIKAMDPYAIILSSGGKPVVPRVPGVEKGIESTEVLNGSIEIKDKSVAVIGGGMTGLETAHKLAADGNKVTVIEMMPIVGNGIFYFNIAKTKQHLEELGAVIKTNTSLLEIKDNSVLVTPVENKGLANTTGMKNIAGFVDEDESEEHDGPYDIECDACVLAIGVQSDLSLLDELESRFDKVVDIGDCAKPGKISDATTGGYFAAKNL